MATALTPEQFERYHRHLLLPEIGVRGQEALLRARVLLVGVGGLGCPLAQYLAAAGVGTLGLVDGDVVDASNLQRQVLYGTRDVGRPKVEVARERIAALNPDVVVEAHPVRLRAAQALATLADYDVVVDGADNFPTRYLLNDVCVRLGKPNVHGSVFRFDGQITVFDARRGPCYRCLYPEPPPAGLAPSCAEGGVLGVLPGLVALIQATETMKLVTGIGEPLIGRLLQYSALDMSFTEFVLRKDPACPACGSGARLEIADLDEVCAAGDEVPVREVSPVEVAARLARGGELLLLDVREADEREKARIEGATWIPLGALETRAAEVSDWKERPVVVHCHRGSRSLRGARVLRALGFRDVASLAGGIDLWSQAVDGAVPRY